MRPALRAAVVWYLIASFAAPAYLAPRITRAQDGEIPNATGGGGGGGGGIGGLFVPVLDSPNLAKNTVTAASTASLKAKSLFDAVATAAIKAVIRVLRDSIKRWIITGRFELPVFSGSFSIDAAKIAENAARIFLSELTGINFCQGFSTPSIENFAFNFSLSIACTLPARVNNQYTDTLIALTTNPSSLSLEERLALADPQNNDVYAYVRTIDEQARRIAQAAAAYAAEYAAGQGFLGIRDPRTGKISTPGSIVAEEIKVSQVVAPHLGAELADDVQTAVGQIIDTAVRVLLERGLSGVLSPEPGGGGFRVAPLPTPAPSLAPVADIRANGREGILFIERGTAAAIAWCGENADPCENASRCVVQPTDWEGTLGRQSTGAVTQPTTYRLTCTDPAGGEAVDAVTVKPNQRPLAEAGISINGGPFRSLVTVTADTPVAIRLSAGADVSGDGAASRDPDGWTTAEIGVGPGGQCAWDLDFNDPSFAPGDAVSRPGTPDACNRGPVTRAFPQSAIGTRNYSVLRITDAAGFLSNVAEVTIVVNPPPASVSSE